MQETILLKGRPIAKKIYKEIKEEIENFKTNGLNISLGIILLGNEDESSDSASEIYSRMIIKNCKKVSVESKLFRFPLDIKEIDLINEIKKINDDNSVHGIIMMLPFPKHINEKRILNTINPDKDIDGVHPINAGKNVMGEDTFVPSTAQACSDIMTYSDINLSGKNVVIIGRSNIVGKPLLNLLIQKNSNANATVTLSHSRSNNIDQICKSADIIIAAIGVTNFVTDAYINSNNNQILIDVGMNESYDADGKYKLTGDINYELIKDKVKAITPVPGGVSPLTHTALFNNLIKAVKISIEMNKSSLGL